MKTILYLAAALLLLGAPAALAQGYQGQSDSYVCNHGDQADPATAEACSRLKAGSGDEAASLPPAPPPPPTAVNPLGEDANQASSQAASAFTNPSPTPAPTVEAKAKPTAPAYVSDSPLGTGSDNMSATAGADQDSAGISIDTSGAHWPWSWLKALGAMAMVVVIIALFSGLAIYFLPTLIAMMRRKRNTPAIFILNLLLGWSFIGWVVALVWSLAVEAP